MRVFRAVHTNPPTERDFESAWEQGRRPVKLSAGSYRAYSGVSTYATLDQLRAKASAFPSIGTYAAEMEIDDWVAHDGPGRDGHVRIVGQTPGLLIRDVVAIHPLDPGKAATLPE